MSEVKATIVHGDRVFIGMWECGRTRQLKNDKEIVFVASHDRFSRAQLRAIADKLDELNGEKSK